jgi:hypothetical protein
MTHQLTHLAAAGVAASLLPPGAVAANTNGTGVSLAGKKGTAAAILNCGAATAGTNPTMDVKLQESDDNSTNWTDIAGAAFPQVTTVAKCLVISFRPGERKQYLRAVATIGGTSSPSFPLSCSILTLPA